MERPDEQTQKTPQVEPVECDRPEGNAGVFVPSHSVDWISNELLDQTIRIWQPLAVESLTHDDAMRILINVAQLFEAIGLSEATGSEDD